MSPAAVDVRYTFMRPWYPGDGRLIREPGTSERDLDNSSVQAQLARDRTALCLCRMPWPGIRDGRERGYVPATAG